MIKEHAKCTKMIVIAKLTHVIILRLVLIFSFTFLVIFSRQPIATVKQTTAQSKKNIHRKLTYKVNQEQNTVAVTGISIAIVIMFIYSKQICERILIIFALFSFSILFDIWVRKILNLN